jgi:hypothetical protein
MADSKSFPVYAESGQIGRVLTSARFLDDSAEKTIVMDGGQELTVPADALEVRRDGSFYLREADRFLTANAASESIPEESIPEEPAPSMIPVSAGTPEVPNEALFQSGYDIETVEVNRIVDDPVPERREGETLILPVHEEVWVVEKKLRLSQEIRITKRTTPVGQAQLVEKSSAAGQSS